MKARIVRDNWAGYEVQVWHWYWPFWSQVGKGEFTNTNTHRTVEDAREFANKLLNKVVEVIK